MTSKISEAGRHDVPRVGRHKELGEGRTVICELNLA
jgi:hypothetical protein